jgi:hypothetical protein
MELEVLYFSLNTAVEGWEHCLGFMVAEKHRGIEKQYAATAFNPSE